MVANLNINIKKDKHTLSALLLYIFWVIGFAFYSFNHEKEKLYQLVDQQLIEAAQIAPLILGKDFHHKYLSKNSLSRDADIENMYKLSAYTDNSTIVYIYTLVLQNNKIFFTSSSATEAERKTKEGLTLFFDHYDDVDPGVFEVFNSKKRKFIEYSDQWGTFRSVFIPLLAKDGSLYITAADISIDHISAELQKHLYRILIIAILFIAFAYPMYFTATIKVKRLARNLKRKVQQQTIELSNKTERLQLAMKASKQSWFDLNIATGEVVVGDEYASLFGYESEPFHSSLDNWKNNIHPQDKDSVARVFTESLEGKEAKEIEYRRKGKNGQWLWIYSIGQVVEWDNDNKPYRMVGIHADISERKRSEQVLRALAETGSGKNEGFFEQIIRELATSHNVKYAFIAYLNKNSTDTATTIVAWVNNKIIENFSYSLSDTPCQQIMLQGVCFYPDNVQQIFPKDKMLVDMGVVSYIGVPLRNSDRKIIGILNMLDDKPMTEDIHKVDLLGSLAARIAIELELRESDKQLNLSSQVFKAAHEAIVITDANSIIVDVNPMFSVISDYSCEEVIGQNLNILSSDKHSQSFFEEIWQKIAQHGFWQGELWNRKKNGALYAGLFTISSILDKQGKVLNYISLFSDITQSKEQQASLELMAHYDVLTGLPNRSLFTDRFKQAIAHSQRSKTLLAVCFLDLDEFKPINDNYGHRVGDLLLIKVAERIKAQLRAEDTVARMGGDEFALLLGDMNSIYECKQMLERLHISISQTYTIEGTKLLISASSGVTLYPNDDADLDTLLRHADQAMYHAKMDGRNQYQFFDSKKNQSRVDKKQRIKAIHKALLNSEMHLYYQPKVNMKTGKVFGVEALIRWIHPSKGIIPPLDFLPIIESTELEIILGEWVINEALKQISQWQLAGLYLEVSVNISSYHLQSADFISKLRSTLANYVEIDSNYLQLEILESSAISDLSTISEIIRSCRNILGLHIALDDFGTGYSSLTHLRNLSANTLKIDQSFVRGVLDNANDYAIIEGIIGLATTFNREMVAEGVETIEQGLMLLTMACEQIQGYIIAKPMPAANVIKWVNHYEPNQQWFAYAKEKKSRIKNECQLFLLCFDRWYTVFAKKINSDPGEIKTWPVIDQLKTHHGIRFNKIKKTQLFNRKLLNDIERRSTTFQYIVNNIFSYYLDGELILARDELASLKEQYQLICLLVNGMSHNKKTD